MFLVVIIQNIVELLRIFHQRRYSLQKSSNIPTSNVGLISKPWSKWSYELHRSRIVKKSAKKWSHRTLYAAFNAWRANCQETKRLHLAGLRVAQKWANWAASKSWEAWCERLILKKTATKLANIWTRRELHSAYMGWTFRVKDQSRMRTICAKVCLRWQNQDMAHAWETWYEQHVKTVRVMKLSRRIVQRWTHGAMSAAWSTWHDEYATAKSHALKLFLSLIHI